MRHLLSINDLTRDDLERILEHRAAAFEEVSDRRHRSCALRGRTVLVPLLTRPRTRTRSSSELAAEAALSATS